MGEVKNSTGDIASNVHAIAVASAVPLSQVPDIESQWRPEEPTAPTAPNFESQMRHVPQQATTAALGHEHDDAGKGLGIALFCNILVGIITSFFLPYVSIVCQISAIVLASVLTCGCCCAANYNLKPHVKKWATATLVTLCLVVILQIIATVIVYTAVGEEVSSTGTISESTANAVVASLVPISIPLYILYALALVFSGLFSFGRGCGAPRASV